MTAPSPTTGLTDPQITRLRAQLVRLRDRATERAEVREEEADGLHSEVIDAPDEALLDVDLVITTRLAGGATAALEAIDAAIARVDEGSYGHCTECGGGVGAERLLALPTAARCLDCQAAAERTRRP
jgi:RNA polymerase-binding protein DksA